jgi:hypothetical protein
MFNLVTTSWLRLLGKPAFRIHGKARREKDWRVIEVHATHRRNRDSRWPRFLFRGTCIAWTRDVIAVGWDFAEELLREQITEPASRDRPVEVIAGRMRDMHRRFAAGGEPWPSASELLAHECGHTWQARQLSWLYLPAGAAFTFFREGPHWYNYFENQASELGQFGGILNDSVAPALMDRIMENG